MEHAPESLKAYGVCKECGRSHEYRKQERKCLEKEKRGQGNRRLNGNGYIEKRGDEKSAVDVSVFKICLMPLQQLVIQFRI